MKISKQSANNIAREIAKPLAEKIEVARKKLQTKAFQFCEKTIPKEILTLYKKYPKHLNDYSYVYLKGAGIVRHIQVSFETRLPLSSSDVELTPSQANEIVKLHDSIEDARKQHKETMQRIETTLLGLGTYNRIKEHLPEAVPFLPTQTTVAVALPIKEVRKEIKALTA